MNGKEVVVHIYNGILLSHIKECIWVISNKVDEPRACYIEYSNSERKKQKLYINTYIWNLEKCYLWMYFQGRNIDADIQYRLLYTAGEEEGGQIDRVAPKYTHYHMWNR